MPDIDLGLRVRLYGSPIRIRRSTYLTRVAGQRDVFVHNSSVHNAMIAASVRVLSAKVGGKYVRIEETRQPPGHSDVLRSAASGIIDHLSVLNPIPLESFPGLYRAGKRVNYQRAVDSLRTKPLTREDSHIQAFIKFEKMLAKPTGAAKAPRMISPPSPRFLVRTGCYIKPAEHAIYEAIDRLFGFKVVTKGLNYSEIGQLFALHWNALDDPVAFDVDVEKMDRSTSSEMLAWTHKLVEACYNGEHLEDISNLLKQQLTVKTRVRCDDGHIDYTVEGTLTSGQMNTSLVGVAMVSSTMFTLFNDVLHVPFRFVDAGDDCTVIINKRDEKAFLLSVRQHFRSVGFEITIGDPSEALENIEFCQTHPVWVDGEYTMVRNARDAAIKDATSLQPLSCEREMAVWMQAVSECGMATHGGVPIAASLYRCYGRNAKRMKQSLSMSMRQLKRFEWAVQKKMDDVRSYNQIGTTVMQRADTSIDPRTRLSYEIATGLNPVFQACMEEYYDKLLIEWSTPAPQATCTFNPLWSTT